MKTKGFTLIELLMVIGLLAVIMGIAVLRFDFFGRISEKRELEVLVHHMNNARNQAVSSGLNYEFVFDSDGYITGEQGGKRERFTTRYLRFYNTSGSGNKVVFTSIGAPDNVSEFRLKGKEKTYSITVYMATGKINVKELE